MHIDREVDLLIAGAGPAGMTAALVASLEGLDVLLCEKSDQVRGHWIDLRRDTLDSGQSSEPSRRFRRQRRTSRYVSDRADRAGTNRETRDAYLQTGPAAIDYLCAYTDVQVIPCGPHPDYRSNIPGAAIAGRAIVPEPFDARLLGDEFRRIRPPIPEFMVFGGMMVGKADIAPLIGRFRSIANFIHSARLFVRYLADRLKYPRGTRLTMGNALVGRLFYSLRRRGVPILFDASIVDAMGDRHGVVGARVNVGGTEIEIRARKGGHPRDRQLRAQQTLSRRFHAPTGSCAFNELRGQSRRRGAISASG